MINNRLSAYEEGRKTNSIGNEYSNFSIDEMKSLRFHPS